MAVNSNGKLSIGRQESRTFYMREHSLKNLVYEGILGDILKGVYQPNAIINEKNLVEQYQVSKTPVREALVQLCSEGILNNIPRLGYQISMITPGEIVEIIEFRKIIEVGAMESCCHRLTEEQIQELRDVNEYTKTVEDSKDTKIHWEINERFHKKLCSFANNRYLDKALNESMRTCTRIANQYFIKSWESDEKEGGNHYRLVQALEEGRPELAKEILVYDIEMMKNRML